MPPDFDDPDALIPQGLGVKDSRTYEERTVDALREHLIGSAAGPVVVDAIDLVGSRPGTLVVFRYHHNPSYLVQHADLAPGPCAEAASLWEFAIDPDDPYSAGMMGPPGALAAAIGSAFDAAELPLVDPVTLAPVGTPPPVFPRVMSDAVADQVRRKFEALRSARNADHPPPQNED
ncbi:MAG: hypothetical protein ACRDPM_21575 [Solirubrobacteraceae bacterium]